MSLHTNIYVYFQARMPVRKLAARFKVIIVFLQTHIQHNSASNLSAVYISLYTLIQVYMYVSVHSLARSFAPFKSQDVNQLVTLIGEALLPALQQRLSMWVSRRIHNKHIGCFFRGLEFPREIAVKPAVKASLTFMYSILWQINKDLGKRLTSKWWQQQGGFHKA